jgi:hypothetical protein
LDNNNFFGGDDIIIGSENVSEQVMSLPLFVGISVVPRIGLVIMPDRLK